MLKSIYLSTKLELISIGAIIGRIETDISKGKGKPSLWEEVSQEDKKNIRQFLKRRYRQDATDAELRHDLNTLVGFASMKVEESLTTADMSQFGEVATRPTRVLPQFLIFTGAESPKCPKCGNRRYNPSKKHPDKMRCDGCSFLYTYYELASMVSRGQF